MALCAIYSLSCMVGALAFYDSGLRINVEGLRHGYGFQELVIAFAFAILSDTGSPPVFPRWLAYVNIWAPITFTPGAILQFFKDGPLAWNGIFVFWIPASVFVIQFIVNVIWLLKAISSEARQTVSALTAFETTLAPTNS